MSNYDVLDNEELYERGELFYIDHVVETVYKMENLNVLKNKVKEISDGDVSFIEDKNLFFMVYPSIIENCNPRVVIKAFNEIIKRIYGDDIKVSCTRKSITVGSNVYSFKEIAFFYQILLAISSFLL